eukprot:Plantae.Rhodophyta-Purpureofilum_apyrenoidigerum.ctg16751.p1 GENE.Plantae.Rhodophyta-Purpureofilum_apyrenoidigerum.ctg16751~~Plantae.Rhodophyta-Purpureofilum_apyrenoidigerum.ctg16751.p1  ORF type:complete len:889 (-),score=150.35 Plantae.Rhodophyta-Purpureofilum_apyrenoidigerum.ctg16751:176-2476(-)
MGAADVLRSSVVSPYVMREWRMFRRTTVVALKAMVAAERPEAAVVVANFYSKLASLCRPISIEPFALVDENLESSTLMNGTQCGSHVKDYYDLNDELVSTVNAENGSNSDSVPPPDAHWRLQSLVATTLYTNLREKHPPTEAVSTYFAESMASDLLSLRQASKKAIALILAMQQRKEKSKRDTDALEAIQRVLLKEGYARKFLHTLALDGVMDYANDVSCSAADGSLGVFSLLSLAKHVDGDACWALVGGKPWPSSWVPRSRDTLNLTRIRLVEIIFATYGSPMLKAFIDPMDELINGEDPIMGVTRENVKTLTAEVIAGIGRGMSTVGADVPYATTEEDRQIVVKWTKQILETFTGHEGMVNGGTLLRLLVSGESGRLGPAISKLIRGEIFEGPLIDMMDPAHIQAKRLRYLHSCIADEIPTKTEAPVENVIPALMNTELLAHPLKHVREEIARCLSLLSSFSTNNAQQVYKSCVVEIADTLRRHSEDATNESTKRIRSLEGDTLSRWVSVVHWNGDTLMFGDYFTLLLPCLFASLDDNDSERTSNARLALSLAAQAKLPQEKVDAVIGVCEDAAQNKRWRIRGPVLPFLQVLAFSRLFAVDESRQARISNIVIQLLGDEQLEVREAAAHTLIPLIRDAPTEAITKTRSIFTAKLEATRKVMQHKRKNPKFIVDSKVLLDRHSAVLGLSSMVMSSPYSVPPWMPEVLVALTRCIEDPPPISTSARKLFAEFWRTHRDEWHNLRHEFGEDELELVSELLISPSYYA